MRHFFLRPVFLTILTLLIGQLALAADPVNPELRKRREAARKQMESTLKNHKDLGTVKMSQVFRIRVEDGRWHLTSDLAPRARNGSFKATIEGIDAVCTIQMLGGRGNEVQSFNLTLRTATEPDEVLTTTSIHWSRGTFTLSRHTQFTDGFRSMNLQQQDAIAMGFNSINQSIVRLNVSETVRQGRPAANFNLAAPDLVQLRRQHPTEVNQFLRPLLRELQLDSLLAADTLVALQVFIHEMEPDAKAMETVRTLVPALDSDSFQKRDEAVLKLKELGMPGAVAVSHLDRTELSPQQNVLLDNVLTPFRPRPVAEAARLRRDVEFLLDCLYIDEIIIRRAALEQLRQVVGKKLEFDLEAGLDARTVAIDKLREQIDAPEVPR